MPLHTWKSKLTRLVVTNQVIVAGLLLFVLGVVLLSVSASMKPENWGSVLIEVIKALGGTFCATATLALVWELSARRAFTREILSYIEMNEDLADAGIMQVSWKYLNVADWSGLFAKTQQLDLFITYARTWRNTYNSDLEAVAARQGVTIRVIHPDPGDQCTTAELARRFNSTPAEVKSSIEESDKYFARLAEANPHGATILRYYVRACPLFSIYRFSNQAILALYSHRLRRTDVPTMLVEAGKPMYKYLQEEFDCLLQRATLLNPPPAQAPAGKQGVLLQPTQRPVAASGP